MYEGHDLRFSRPRYVINHVTIRFAISYWWSSGTEPLFLTGFLDICIQIYLGHDFDLSG